MFTTFPGGWPGVGLLLLRVAVGVATVIHGGSYLVCNSNPTPAIWPICSLEIASGVLLLIGLLSPVVSVLLSLRGFWLSWPPAIAPSISGAKLTVLLAATVAAALAMLGPGAYSLDARFFGRREVIVPRPQHNGFPR